MATTLAESRKYKLFYAGLANQYLGQYGEQVREAILGNVGTLIAFQVGHEAEMLAEELGAGLQADDLRQLPLYHAYIRTPVGGIPATFSMRTLPPRQTANDHERIASIRRTSHQRYAKRSKAAAA